LTNLSASPGDPHRDLAAAILKRAVDDAINKNGLYAWPARLWLVFNPLARTLLAEFGIEQRVVLRWVRTLPLVRPVWVGPAPVEAYQARQILRWQANFDS
jgi:hypothetical protein